MIYKIVKAWQKKGKQVGTYINYRLEHNKNKLEKKVEKYKAKDTDVLWFSSGSFGDGTFISWLAKNTNFGKKKSVKKYLYIIIYHPNEVDELAWDSKNMFEKKKELKYICSLAKVTFRGFKYMDTYK